MINRFFIKPFVFIGLMSLFNACASEEEGPGSFDPSNYKYDMVHVESTYLGCKSGNEDCTYMSFDYPEFKNPESSEVLKKIDRKVEALMLAYTEANSPQSACNSFIKNYENVLNDPDMDEYEAAWFDVRKTEWLSIEKKVFSLKCKISNYMGGAHPNSFVLLRNFSPYTGDSLGLGTIFTPESLRDLSRLAEQQFRKTKKIKNGVSYEDAGYWFKNNKFYLTGNFAFTAEGLLFYYNEYEIAPYSMGAIYFVVPYPLIMHLFE